MTDEFSMAVSIANSYFTLVDGLSSGLKDCLSEDVVLDWFGKTVQRKENVNTFLNDHKINTRHVFSNIVPTESIRHRKKIFNRKFSSQLNESKKIKDSNNLNENVDNSLLATDGNHLMEGVSYQICDSDSNNTAKPEITPTIVEEIEKNIEMMKKMKVEEAAETTIKKNFCQGSGSKKKIQAQRFHFIEATGQIHLWKERKNKDVYNTYPTWIHVCKRPCKVLIAYSLIESKSFSHSKNIDMDDKLKPTVSESQRRKLASFEEMCELSSHLIPNINHFGGYLRRDNFSEDRDNFLKILNDEIASKNSSIPRYVPQYVENKLVFHKTDPEECEQSKDFVFNYQIHMIIYKDDKQREYNLSEEFAEME